jgi:hypothetical protein
MARVPMATSGSSTIGMWTRRGWAGRPNSLEISMGRDRTNAEVNGR